MLNYILGCEHGLRICVVVNELGEIDIDSLLVETKDAAETKGNGASAVSQVGAQSDLGEPQFSSLFPLLAHPDGHGRRLAIRRDTDD